ncbi:MAG TPA: ATP-binding protein [Thermoanaerobaculia bacterium]|jgi:two-component system phosphate regulon sensor histidine kinase PhoR
MSRFFRRAALPALAGLVLGVLFALVLGRVLDGAVRERERGELITKLDRLVPDFERDLKARSVAHDHVRLAARQAGARLTLIASDGTVLSDSEVAPEQLGSLENHGSRPEILAARRDVVGFGERKSTTVLEPFVYVARRVGEESSPVGYLRLAISQNDLDALEAPFRRTLMQISVLTGLMVAVVVAFIRQRHARDLDRVRAGVADAAAGRHPDPPEGSSEETQEVFVALARFARLVSAEREGSAKARVLARTVFEQVPAGLLVVDGGLGLLDANQAALSLFHVPAGAPRAALVDLVRHPDALHLFEAGVAASSSEAAPSSAILRFGGELTPEQILEITVRSVPHRETHGEPAAIGVVRDVTEREHMETMRRRFVSDVSHELRTPIAAIRAAVETLAGEDELPSDIARLLGILERQSSEMEALVSDLTDLSQIESGAVTLQPERISIKALLTSVVRDLQSAAEARRVTVFVETPEGLAVSGDRRRLAQVFRNLVDNAVKFSPAGARVDVLAEGGSPGADGLAPCVVHVVDRGIGIPRSEQARIFQRFYRVDPSRAKSVPGTGLGLAIVKHILILHGGSIRVESEPGKGSRFTVSLPATTPREAPVLEETT